MKTYPTVSIAMATCNGAHFITEQLESFTRQSILPAELVVTDDASSDGTPDIIAAFALRAPFPVRIEKNPARIGYRANFMKAVGLCRSDLIAFSDQDDVWLPHKLETSLAAFDGKDTLLAYHNAIAVTAALEPLGTLELQHAAPSPVNAPCSIEPWRYGLGFTLTFRRELLVFARHWPQSADFYYPDEPEAHDQWFFFLASCLGAIGYIAEPQVLYRQHKTNIHGWGGGNSGLGEKWRNLASTDAAWFSSRETAAGKRASILEHIEKESADDLGYRAGLAASGYRKLETVYRLRREIYRSDALIARLSALMASLRAGIYRPKIRWGVGRQALARDMICGVIVPPRKASAQT